ncbi:hypothetical protein, partial [Methanoculleus sp.]|uniref:hypothetical protein n=1 Tax=Methanoculleus sp. TaxID=90427 RepID=UPI0025E45D04
TAMKKKYTEILDYSHNLKAIIESLEIESALKVQIDTFIKNHEQKKMLPCSNAIYRGNLHYIIDNISKKGLIDELISFNSK